MSSNFTSEEALRFVENARSGFAFVDEQGVFRRVNQAYCEILGCMTSVLVVGTHWKQWTHPADVAGDDELATKVKSGEISGYVLKKRYIPYGENKWSAKWGILSVIGCRENEEFIGYQVQFIPTEESRLSIASIGQLLLWMTENKAALILALTVAAGAISLLQGGTLADFLRLLSPGNVSPTE